MITYNEMSTEILSDRSASAWLRKAVVELSARNDCCEAMRDVQTLGILYDLKVNEACALLSLAKGPFPMCDASTAKLFSDDPDNH